AQTRARLLHRPATAGAGREPLHTLRGRRSGHRERRGELHRLPAGGARCDRKAGRARRPPAEVPSQFGDGVAAPQVRRKEMIAMMRSRPLVLFLGIVAFALGCGLFFTATTQTAFNGGPQDRRSASAAEERYSTMAVPDLHDFKQPPSEIRDLIHRYTV